MPAPKSPARGSQHYRAKLTEDDVKLLLACKAERDRLLSEARELSNARLAGKFGVNEKAVERIFYRAGWGHV